MVLELNFEKDNNHPSNWYLGYKYNCHGQKEIQGPKNGTLIKFKNLPVDGKNNYLRFWAAKKKKTGIWQNTQKAYNEQDSNEEEPALDYFNGGFVKINKNGTAMLRLVLPSGYYNKNNQIEAPHIHYRICSNGAMSGVFTQDIQSSMIESNLGVISNPNYLINKY